MDTLGGEGVPGEESGEEEALVAPEWPGQWRRLQSSEVGKKTSPGRLATMEELREHAEAASRTERARGPLFIVQRGRFVAAVVKFAGESPPCSGRVLWWRR